MSWSDVQPLLWLVFFGVAAWLIMSYGFSGDRRRGCQADSATSYDDGAGGIIPALLSTHHASGHHDGGPSGDHGDIGGGDGGGGGH
jgi:hypothetical protein